MIMKEDIMMKFKERKINIIKKKLKIFLMIMINLKIKLNNLEI